MQEDIEKEGQYGYGYGTTLNGPSGGSKTHLRDYMHVIRKHKWTVITTFVVLVTTVTIGSYSTTPTYSASTTIQIEKEPPKVLSFDDVLPIDTNNNDYYQTQHKIIQSRAIARMVIEELALWNHPQFQRSGAGNEANAAVLPAADVRLMQKSIDSFLSRLSVEMIRNSRLARITFNSEYPELSSDAANQVASSYIEFNMESKYKTTEKAREWLSEQLEEFQDKVEHSEKALYTFARRHGIFSLEKNENIVLTRLEGLNEAFTKAESDRISKESFYKEISKFSTDNIPLTQYNEFDLINDFKRTLSNLEGDYFKLSKQYKPGYPKLVRLKAQMESLSKMIAEESRNLVSRAEAAYRISLEKERLLKKAFDDQKELALSIKDRSIKYNILKREVDTNKELYDGLLQRVKETGVSAGLEASNIQVVDRAEVPASPSSPRKKLNIFLGMIMGSFLGVGLAFFIEYFDNTIKDPEEVTRLFNIPILGLIPSLQSTLSKRGRKEKGSHAHPSIEDLYLVSHKFPRATLSEACRTFRTSLLFSTPGHAPKTILVTSNSPKEGKTFVSCNLAIVLAQGGAKTLLVDTDLRWPACHKAFSVPMTPGLTDLLTGHATLAEVVKPTDLKGLSILAAGPISPNPPELLGSAEFKEAIRGLEAEYDFIVFDTAPIMHFADTLNLSNIVDGAVLVAHSGKTLTNDFKNSLGLMRGIKAPVLGFVMNVVDVRKSGYYYNNYYYHYGEGAEKGTSSPAS
ncbi:MAG: polysaccharide biosynthesis tyrosine autokinase [Thermodesulfobacteriota bacterium]